MVDKEPVPLAPDLADARERAVQAVAPPVDHEAERGDVEPGQVLAGQGVRDGREDGPGDGDAGQRVRRDPPGKALSHEREHPPLKPRQKDVVDPALGERGAGRLHLPLAWGRGRLGRDGGGGRHGAGETRGET